MREPERVRALRTDEVAPHERGEIEVAGSELGKLEDRELLSDHGSRPERPAFGRVESVDAGGEKSLERR
jgi:hypothetical protein